MAIHTYYNNFYDNSFIEYFSLFGKRIKTELNQLLTKFSCQLAKENSIIILFCMLLIFWKSIDISKLIYALRDGSQNKNRYWSFKVFYIIGKIRSTESEINTNLMQYNYYNTEEILNLILCGFDLWPNKNLPNEEYVAHIRNIGNIAYEKSEKNIKKLKKINNKSAKFACLCYNAYHKNIKELQNSLDIGAYSAAVRFPFIFLNQPGNTNEILLESASLKIAKNKFKCYNILLNYLKNNPSKDTLNPIFAEKCSLEDSLKNFDYYYFKLLYKSIDKEQFINIINELNEDKMGEYLISLCNSQNHFDNTMPPINNIRKTCKLAMLIGLNFHRLEKHYEHYLINYELLTKKQMIKYNSQKAILKLEG